MGSPTSISEIRLTSEKLERTEGLKFIELNFMLETKPLPNPQPSDIHLWTALGKGAKLDVPAVLARYAGLEEADLASRLVKGPKGKPELTGSELRFNISTTADLAVAAVSFQRKLGVDVEKIRLPDRWDQVARKYFGDEMANELGSLDEDRRARAFMEAWTLAEAWIKAQGDGVFDRPKASFPDGHHWRAFRFSYENHTGALVIER